MIASTDSAITQVRNKFVKDRLHQHMRILENDSRLKQSLRNMVSE